MQGMFRSPLKDILGVGCPLLLRKEAGLALVKRSAERTPKVAGRRRAIQEVLDSRAISPGISVRDVPREPGTPPTQFL